MSRLASPLVTLDWVAAKISPPVRCSAGHASGSTVATVAGAAAPPVPSAVTDTGAVAAGRISRSATHSVSLGRPSKGRATNGAAAGPEGRSVVRRVRRRLALPMPGTLVAGRATRLRRATAGGRCQCERRRDGPPRAAQTVRPLRSSVTPHS